MGITELNWETVVGIRPNTVWVLTYVASTPAEAANLTLTAKTVIPYQYLMLPPKNVDWGCGKGKPIANDKAG